MWRTCKWVSVLVGSTCLGWGIAPPRFPNDEKFVVLGVLILCVSALCLCAELNQMRRDRELP